tara:strand:+ start:649 stop:1197 length:549 start_codon:yes stop_codon:yes gene_type:complete
MDFDLIENLIDKINFFDVVFSLVMIYFLIQCTTKGFALSLISFMKWILALVITIFLLPKLQPWVSEFIDSPFLNDVGLGIAIYFISLFIIIMISKAIGSSVKWTGFGSMDKAFGLLFGIFKGYIVSVCLFSITNWFYPFNNWGIDIDSAYSFEFVKKGSEILIEEFPQRKDLEDTKDKIEKI